MLIVLFLVALVAGFVDAIAGGGGLLTVPTLFLAGLEPATALATNKLQSSAGSFTASRYFVKNKLVDLKTMRGKIALTFVGSVCGSWLLTQIDPKKLMLFLPILLIIMAIYTLFSPKISDQETKQRMTVLTFLLFITPLLGFYDGFFGPGTGSFIALAYVSLLGYGLSKATAHAKVLNFTSNISALSYFVLFGEIDWAVGGVMMIGQYLGATLGAKMVVNKGAKLIKPVMVTMCLLMSVNLIIKNYF